MALKHSAIRVEDPTSMLQGPKYAPHGQGSLFMIGQGTFIGLPSDRSVHSSSVDGLRCLGVFSKQPSMGWKDFAFS